jgi:hypothetical protein
MNRNLRLWMIKQLPDTLKKEIKDYQYIHGICPGGIFDVTQDTLMFNVNADTYIDPDISRLRQHDRDILILSDAAGDHNYEAVQRMWNVEQSFMILYSIAPVLPYYILMCIIIAGVLSMMWIVEAAIGSTLIVSIIFWLIFLKFAEKWLTLPALIDIEFDNNGKYDFFTDTGRTTLRKTFGICKYFKMVFSDAIYPVLSSKLIAIGMFVGYVIIVMNTGGFNNHGFHVIEWCLSWTFTIIKIIYIVLFKMLPIQISMLWHMFF